MMKKDVEASPLLQSISLLTSRREKAAFHSVIPAKSRDPGAACVEGIYWFPAFAAMTKLE